MSIIRIRDPDEIRPVHVVMLAVVVLGVAANCWLTSASQPAFLPDGAREWREDSLLLAVVELLNLNYSQPTPLGVAIKTLATMTAAGIGVLIAGISIVSRCRGEDQIVATDTVIDIRSAADRDAGGGAAVKKHINPVHAAQLLLAAAVVWAVASMTWSASPEFALNESILYAAQVSWAFALYVTLNRRMARYAAPVLIALLAVTGLLAVLYHGERNPVVRASYPVGNPIVLATYMGAGLMLALAMLPAGVAIAKKRAAFGVAVIVLGVIAIALMADAAYLAWSRGPMMGAAVGVLTVLFFALNRKCKWIIVVAAVIGLILVAWFFLGSRDAASSTGRSMTIRVRLHAWRYAMNLVAEKPATGFGMGGFALNGDALASTATSGDVLSDPEALVNRISHAHNEWLEVGADLGVVGMVLIGGGLILTLYAGGLAVGRRRGPDRWMLIGLLSALVASIVAESAGVALRLEGFALIFYALIGLIWVMSGDEQTWPDAISRRRWASAGACIGAIALCLLFLEMGRRDFAAARASAGAETASSQGRPAEAVNLLQSSADLRLRPIRRLAAMRQLAAAHLEAADQLQVQCFRRLSMAAQGGGADSSLLQLANQDRAMCAAHIELGTGVVARIQSAAIDGFNTGRIVSGFKRILASFAQVDGDMVAADQHRLAAAEALKSQLARNPFDPSLAAAFVSTAAADLSIEQVFETLAIPLRVNRIAGAYVPILGSIGQYPRFADVVTQTQNVAQDSLLVGPSEWSDAWIPEKMRLLAAGYFAAGSAERAVDALKVANQLYGKLDRASSLARASCMAELADAKFYANPFDPQVAIDAAQEALNAAPDSQPGRQLNRDLGDRIIAYLLAADREDDARTRAMKLRRVKADDVLDAYISDTYVALGYSLFNTMAERDRLRLSKWSRRAIELDAEAEAGWYFAADVALLNEDESRAVECIRAVIERSSQPENVVDLLDRARRMLPNSDAIKRIRDQVRQQLGLPPEQPSSVQPPGDSDADAPQQPASPQPAPSERTENQRSPDESLSPKSDTDPQ